MRPRRRPAALATLAPLPWLILGVAESTALALGPLVAASVAIALTGSALAWRWRFSEDRLLARVVVGSHALYLATAGFSL